MCLHLVLQRDITHYIQYIVFVFGPYSSLVTDIACSATAIAKGSFYDTFYINSFLSGKILECNMYCCMSLNFTFKCIPCRVFLLA